MGFGCHRNLFLSSRVAAWQEQPGHSINHFCRSWWWCIPSALSVHAIVCTLQIPCLIHLLPPRPNTHAPSTLPELLQEGGQLARPCCGEEGAPLPLPNNLARISLVGSKPRYLSGWTKFQLNTAAVWTSIGEGTVRLSARILNATAATAERNF